MSSQVLSSCSFLLNAGIALALCLFLLHAGLGVFVLQKNPQNIINRRFCIFAQVLAIWALFVFLTLQTTDPVLATFRLRLVFCAALFMPSTFFFFTSIFPDGVERSFDKRLSIFFFAISTILVFFSPKIVESVSFEKNLPHAHYGLLFPTFWLYFIVCKAYSLYNLYRKSLHSYGIKRLQIQYLYLGVAMAVFLGSVTNYVLPLTGVWQVERFVPLVTIPIPLAVAYAIVRYHLMDIYLIIKRSTVYGTLSLALGVTYFMVGLILGTLLPVSEYKETITNIVATSVIALTFIPARESIQHFIERTVFHTEYSHPKILRDSTLMFSSIHDLNGLLRSAIQSLYDSIGIEKICILLKDERTENYIFKKGINFSNEDDLFIPSLDPVVAWLWQNRTCLSREQLKRFQQSNLDNQVEVKLTSLDVDNCIPVFLGNVLFAIILLGKKVNNKAFTSEDVQMFLAFSGQLGMAIYNAQLYGELKEAKTYRDNILQSLRSGVIVVDNNEKITLINNEAKKIIGLKDTASNGRVLERFGKDAHQLFRYALTNNIEYREGEVCIESGGKKTPYGVTITRLNSEVGARLGTLIILTDLTELKLLQTEKQHSDRLASIGALAANIAHEIKNPLVAINTYFQLLPHKKDDEEFTRDFQKIATSEVERINRILEDLLNLARPSQPIMQLINPHHVIISTVNLLKNDAAKKGIKITTDFNRQIHELIADGEKIKQALINILQNSFDAVPENGCISISTSLSDDLSEFRKMLKKRPTGIFFSFNSHHSTRYQNNKQYLVIKVSDNGAGIPAEELPHLFEPFFTTKHKGTGLGLFIVYGIIKDHKGGIYVESRKGQGTDFYISIPLASTNPQ
ncbi:MAG TPA: ATP-binding protein [Candidatus Hypogeohydataceae bacterium YC41]